MKVSNAFKVSPWRAAVAAIAMTGALAGVMVGSASAAVNELTVDSTAALSPGHMHATLTGSVTCDPGMNALLNGQIVQPKGGSGFGGISVVCTGTPQPYSIDVSSGGIFGPAAVFKAGKASAQVSTQQCDPFTWVCSSTYTDAIIRLTK